MAINSGSELLQLCIKEELSLSQAAIKMECTKGNYNEEEIIEKMSKHWESMKTSIYEGLNNELSAKMFKDDAKKIRKYSDTQVSLSGQTVTRAVSYALSVMEVNCSMGRIVASPTAGSCGVIPAALLSTVEVLQLDDKKAVEGLLVAGIVGSIIGKNASLSGAQGGCQAEIGSAAAMAAAALVEMAGGTPKQSLDAAAIALKNVMGLVCDPVAGLVEVPCAKRNGMGVTNALIASDMVLAGVESVIPFDEVVWAMDRVGKSLPASLRETSRGGVAITPTGIKLHKKIFGGE